MIEDHRGVVGTTGASADRQQDLAKLLDREILPCLERPGRLLGPFDLPSATVTGETKLALVWPSVAEGAHAPAALRPWLVDLPDPRPFFLTLGSVSAPGLYAALRERGLPAFGRPDWEPLAEADAWLVWLDHPLQLLGLLSILEDSGLPIRACERESSAPRVILAGPAAAAVESLARVYSDAVLTGATGWDRLDSGTWDRLSAALSTPDPATTLDGRPAPEAPRRPEEPLPEIRVDSPNLHDLAADLCVAPEFLHRAPWREPGRGRAFTDHLVVGPGSQSLRERHGLPSAQAISDFLGRSLSEEAGSLCLHFVTGLEGEAEADRLAIAEFIRLVVRDAPRGPRQVSVVLHELALPDGAAPEFGPEAAERIARVFENIRARRLSIRAASPGLAAIEAVLRRGPQSAPVLELVHAAGARHAEDEWATSWALWREALDRMEGPRSAPAVGASTDRAKEPESTVAAETGLSRLKVQAPVSTSPSAPRTRRRRDAASRPDRWTRWQALVPRQFDYRIEFAKEGRLRFLASSELSDLLLGACERARIPVRTTGVVQPRPKVGYGPALQVGVEGVHEYIDLALREKVRDLGDRLRTELPEQLRLRAVEFMPRCSPSMQLSRLALAEYEARLDREAYKTPAAREQDIARVRQWGRRISEGLLPEGALAGDPIHQLREIEIHTEGEAVARLGFTLDLRQEGPRCKPREVLARALPGLDIDPRQLPLRRLRLLMNDESSGRARLRTPLEMVAMAKCRQRALERVFA